MRYQFYREHKYVSSALNDVERLIAKTDFRNELDTLNAQSAFQELTEMLEGHAHYENEKLHRLLDKKGSKVHQHAEDEHALQQQKITEIQSLFNQILEPSINERIALGYNLYLTYRKFVADNLAHLHEEETLILPELQRLYTDEELKRVEAETYNIMSSDEMIEMLRVLFPHMNSVDKEAFLSDIKECQPDKYADILKTSNLDFLELELP